MSRIGVMMLAGQAEASLSTHFGKAPWLMVLDTEHGATEFVSNEPAHGCSMAGMVIEKGCTDVIVVDIGDGALAHLQAAQIRVWAAPGPVTGGEAVRMLQAGQLANVPVAQTPGRHGAGQGGCCGHGGGHGTGHGHGNGCCCG